MFCFAHAVGSELTCMQVCDLYTLLSVLGWRTYEIFSS